LTIEDRNLIFGSGGSFRSCHCQAFQRIVLRSKETIAMYMKCRLAYKMIAACMAVLFFTAPLLGQIQPEDKDDFILGRADGQRDAKVSPAWFWAGFCFGPIGVFIAYSHHPSPSAAALIGKSEPYIVGYKNGYKFGCASRQGVKALYGCGALFLIAGVVAFVGFLYGYSHSEWEWEQSPAE